MDDWIFYFVAPFARRTAHKRRNHVKIFKHSNTQINILASNKSFGIIDIDFHDEVEYLFGNHGHFGSFIRC